ncbi:MAG: hypothetical protein HYZ51_00855 [Candidatus Doudnabacteria bacterium]|nr:hypothetical protein [Candidatus Doudnabacteria bacterium]
MDPRLENWKKEFKSSSEARKDLHITVASNYIPNSEMPDFVISALRGLNLPLFGEYDDIKEQGTAHFQETPERTYCVSNEDIGKALSRVNAEAAGWWRQNRQQQAVTVFRNSSIESIVD